MEIKSQLYVGLLGIEATGLTERSIALDIAHALCLDAGFKVVFHIDLAFDDHSTVWKIVEQVPRLDALLVSLRPTAATLLHRLHDAICNRLENGLSFPIIAFGGATALAAPKEISAKFPGAIVCSGSVENGFLHLLRRLGVSDEDINGSSQLRPLLLNPTTHIAMPAQFSTKRCLQAGGSVWIEASRGCLLNCSFCVLSNVEMFSKWLHRPVGELFDEIALIQERFGVDYFSFADFSAFETTDYVAAFLAERKRRNMTFSFRCDMRLGTAQKLVDQLVALRDAGLTSVYVGVESVVPEYRRLYRKLYPGRSIIDYMQSLGILVCAGFITLDPLHSPEDFRRQIIGIRDERFLDLIATPFKTMRIQRGTQYEEVAKKSGIIDGLTPDLYSYSYHCLNPKMEIVRQIVEFFHQTTKDTYYNPYIEGQIRQAGHEDDFVRRLHGITVRYKEAQMRLLEELSAIVTRGFGMDRCLQMSLSLAENFCKERRKIFASTANDYEELLENKIPYYHHDLEKFINTYQEIPIFDSELIAL